jgi:hypothetical protein
MDHLGAHFLTYFYLFTLLWQQMGKVFISSVGYIVNFVTE